MYKKQKGSEGIIFLKLFTREILLNLIEKKSLNQVSGQDNSTVLKEISEVEKVFKGMITNPEQKRINMLHRETIPAFQPLIMPKEEPKKEEEKQIEEPPLDTPEEKSNDNLKFMQRSIGTPGNKIVEINKTPQRTDIRRLLATPIQNRNIPPMEKIGPLLRDNTIVTIECPGPGKNVMIKKYNQINMTRIILAEDEIKTIIEYFSNEARIPLAGGILKAAVGNSVMSAVVSEFVGSRFIINKITPYSLIGPKE
jgi:hypothetical protein